MNLDLREYLAGQALLNLQNVLLRKSNRSLLDAQMRELSDVWSGARGKLTVEEAIAMLAVDQADALVEVLNRTKYAMDGGRIHKGITLEDTRSGIKQAEVAQTIPDRVQSNCTVAQRVERGSHKPEDGVQVPAVQPAGIRAHVSEIYVKNSAIRAMIVIDCTPEQRDKIIKSWSEKAQLVTHEWNGLEGSTIRIDLGAP